MYASRFAYTPGERNLDDESEISNGAEYSNSLIAFIQVEAKDEEEDVLSREKKLVNHLKWALRKNQCKKVILHSFAHLSASKATVSFTHQVFDRAVIRLRNAGMEAEQTPFGYFLNLSLDAPGFSLARIWADL